MNNEFLKNKAFLELLIHRFKYEYFGPLAFFPQDMFKVMFSIEYK